MRCLFADAPTGFGAALARPMPFVDFRLVQVRLLEALQGINTGH